MLSNTASKIASSAAKKGTRYVNGFISVDAAVELGDDLGWVREQ
jgi:hypothetical protein